MTAHIEQLKHQLHQLQALAQSGALPAEQAQAAQARLERQLLDAVMGSINGPAAGPTTTSTPSAITSDLPARASSRLLWIGMTTFVLLIGAGTYAWVGTPAAWQIGPGSITPASATASPAAGLAAGDPSASAPHALGTEQINQMVDRLAAKLKAAPNNAEGWAMLARSRAALGQFDEAVAAYKQAAAMMPGDAQIFADYADALGAKQGRQLQGEPARLIAKALSLDANNFKALSLSGTLAFEQGDHKGAADLWARALQHAPADSPELTRQVREALQDARQQAALPKPTPTTPAAAATPQPRVAAPGRVAGTVTLSDAVVGQVAPQDTVFIYAKATQGPKMPLAILRKQVRDLPARFELTDAMAMSTQTPLSSATEVVVTARVSKSGQAMPQPGDWQGQSGKVRMGATNVQVDISQAVH